MADEMVFGIDGPKAVAAEPVTLADLGLREREHLQEWVLAHPAILGPDVMVVTSEYDRWSTGAGEETWDRLDVLGLDRTGRTVVAELKRDKAPNTVTMQALNYAAMVSRFTLDSLAEAHASYGAEVRSAEEAMEVLRSWAPAISDETLRDPAIVLIAGGFAPSVTNTALYLYGHGIDIRLVRVQPYRTPKGELVVTVSQLLPVPTAEAFMVQPRSSTATRRAVATSQTRRASIAERLVASDLLAEGAELRIEVPANVKQDVKAIEEWLDEEPSRRIVAWAREDKAPVVWAPDGESYNMSRLIEQIIETATGEGPQAQVWGPNWYLGPGGVPLHKLAEQLDEPITEVASAD